MNADFRYMEHYVIFRWSCPKMYQKFSKNENEKYQAAIASICVVYDIQSTSTVIQNSYPMK